MQFTAQKILTDLSATLNMDTELLTDDLILADHGLDSLRLIMLVEQWRAEGYSVELHDLLASATIGQWLHTLVTDPQ